MRAPALALVLVACSSPAAKPTHTAGSASGSGSSAVAVAVDAAPSPDAGPQVGDPTTMFGPPRALTLGSDDVAIADLDGDGALDLAAIGFGDVSIMLGDGHGGFARPTAFEDVGEIPIAITAGDLDGDGRIDLAIASDAHEDEGISSSVQVRHNDGHGKFRRGVEIHLGTSVMELEAADLDRDGDLDLVTLDDLLTRVEVLLGDGRGEFAEPVMYESGRGPTGLEIADVDGDGDPDVITASSYEDRLSVMLGDGHGGLAITKARGLGPQPSDIAFGDVDGDGHLDLVSANAYDPLSVALGDGKGDFGDARSIPGTDSNAVVAVRDLDGDGRADVVLGSTQVRVLLGYRDGDFTASAAVAPIDQPRAIQLADLDQDGALDVVITGVDEIDILRSPAASVPAPPPAALTTIPDGQACPADMAEIPGEPTYCLDLREVTVASYQACLDAGACSWPTPRLDWGFDQYCNWGGADARDAYPINCVGWTQATSYCAWAGRRLPTTAEWQWAWGNGDQGATYPWGEKFPDATRANACDPSCQASLKKHDVSSIARNDKPLTKKKDGWPETAPVGSFPAGANRWGVLDLAGNVQEWLSDEDLANPGNYNTLGGSWLTTHPGNTVGQLFRGLMASPRTRDAIVGFRCAR